MKTYKKYYWSFLWIPLMAAALALVVMLLWNSIIPGIFGLCTINFWQALGLLVLTRILFGSLGHGFRSDNYQRNSRRNMVYDKWSEMNPDQRREFIRNRGRHHHFREECFNAENREKQ